MCAACWSRYYKPVFGISSNSSRPGNKWNFPPIIRTVIVSGDDNWLTITLLGLLHHAHVLSCYWCTDVTPENAENAVVTNIVLTSDFLAPSASDLIKNVTVEMGKWSPTTKNGPATSMLLCSPGVLTGTQFAVTVSMQLLRIFKVFCLYQTVDC